MHRTKLSSRKLYVWKDITCFKVIHLRIIGCINVFTFIIFWNIQVYKIELITWQNEMKLLSRLLNSPLSGRKSVWFSWGGLGSLSLSLIVNQNFLEHLYVIKYVWPIKVQIYMLKENSLIFIVCHWVVASFISDVFKSDFTTLKSIYESIYYKSEARFKLNMAKNISTSYWFFEHENIRQVLS